MAANTRSSRPTRATSTRKPRESDPSVDSYDPEPLDDAEAQEAEATGRHMTVSLCGEQVRVVPASAWPMSAQRAMRQNDFDTFMEKILHTDDYERYLELDPTLTEFNQFIEDVSELSGDLVGKSSGPRVSSRRTPRR